MVPGERLSAVAKRRRLNGDIASPSPSPTPPKGLAKTSLTDQEKIPDLTNSFDALIDSNSDRRGLVKEIATVSLKAVVVRLSEGARCHVSGVYGIWVKKGAVLINSALIDTKSPKRTIHAPRTYNIPSIIGQSKEIAEFEIFEIEETLPKFFGQKHFLWATPDNIPLYRSFIILGLPSPSHDDFRPSELNELYTEDARKCLRVSARTPSAGKAPVVVLTGARVQGASAHISLIVNQLLCASGLNKRLAYPDGIIFVDLDLSIPEFAPPGTISIMLVKSPLFGPPFSHPGVHVKSARSIDSACILEQEWVGNSTSTATRHACLRLLTQATNLFHERKTMPLLIKGYDYFDSLTDDNMNEIAAKLEISHVFSFCANRVSGNDRSGQLLATAAKSIFEAVHIPAGVEPSLAEQHKLSLQSHFHSLQGVDLSQKKWFDGSFADVPHAETLKTLYYGEELEQPQPRAKITAIWPGFDHDYFSNKDLNQILTGSLVALVLEPAKGDQPILLNASKTTEKEPRPISLSTGSHSMLDQIKILRDIDTRLPIVRGGLDLMHAKRCLGLGIIKNINCKEETITLWTSVSLGTLQKCHETVVSLHLYLIKRDVEGRNDTSWALGQ